MKKLLTILSFIAVFIACNKVAPEVLQDTNKIVVPDGWHEVVLNGTVAATKTAYKGETEFSWSAGDQISVLYHNGTTNKFYTFTANAGDISGSHNQQATFHGIVEDGYTIGASDTGTKWALFPADSKHSYDPTADDSSTYKVNFSIPSETDFTASHDSANIPMEGRGDGSNNFTFTNISACYKFTFTGLTAVSKVKLEVYNAGNDYKLSGVWPLRSSSGYYIDGGKGTGSKTVSHIRNVSGGTVSFYIPYRFYRKLKPKVTVTNMDAGSNYGKIIYQATAKDFLTGEEEDRDHIVVIPSKDLSSYGVGVTYFSQYGVNWNSPTASASGDVASGKDALKTIKAYASPDGKKLYLYYELDATKLRDVVVDYSNKLEWYLSDGVGTSDWSHWAQKFDSHQEIWCKHSNVISLSEWSDNWASGFTKIGDILYVEHEVLRSGYTCLQGTSCAVGLTLNEQVYNDDTYSKEIIGYAPAESGSMLSITLPTYVAP